MPHLRECGERQNERNSKRRLSPIRRLTGDFVFAEARKYANSASCGERETAAQKAQLEATLSSRTTWPLRSRFGQFAELGRLPATSERTHIYRWPRSPP